MAQCNIKVEVRLAWWVMPYLRAVEFFSRIHVVPPDFQKLERTVLRGIRVISPRKAHGRHRGQ
jgi:hypothetical protein